MIVTLVSKTYLEVRHTQMTSEALFCNVFHVRWVELQAKQQRALQQ